MLRNKTIKINFNKLYRCHEYHEFAVCPFLCVFPIIYIYCCLMSLMVKSFGRVKGTLEESYLLIWIKWNTSLFAIHICFIYFFALCDFIYKSRVSHLIVVWPRYWLSVEDNPHHTKLVLWGWVRFNPNSKIVSNNVLDLLGHILSHHPDTLHISNPRCWE
jgi:hypothetical protein